MQRRWVLWQAALRAEPGNHRDAQGIARMMWTTAVLVVHTGCSAVLPGERGSPPGDPWRLGGVKSQEKYLNHPYIHEIA